MPRMPSDKRPSWIEIVVALIVVSVVILIAAPACMDTLHRAQNPPAVQNATWNEIEPPHDGLRCWRIFNNQSVYCEDVKE